MKSYIKIIITAIVTATITFSATTIFFTINRFTVKEPYTTTQGLQNKLDTINTYIEKNYLYDDVDYKKANDAAIKAYVQSLEEPYTNYYTKDEFENFIERVEDSYIGVGIIISADMENDKIVVVSPFKDSPAYKAGIEPGDYIVAVDGKKYAAKDMDACINTIKKGEAGTKVTITIERDGSRKDYEVEREVIVENSVEYKMLDGKIGYIAISGFKVNTETSDVSTYTEFVDAMEVLQGKGMQKLIIDVRDNPGGALDIVCDVADYLLPKGIITYTETKTGVRNEYKSDAHEVDIPMVVLINGSSASASEILTGALKDYKRAQVVGVTSYGKGIVQHVLPLSDGSGMSMTVSKYFTPNGTSIHGVGIEPDVTVELPEEYKENYVHNIPDGEDTQLNKAIEILKAQ